MLRINERTGVATQGSVVVDAGGPIDFRIEKPSSGGSGRFVLHLDVGSPPAHTITRLASLGKTCFPFLVNQGMDSVAIFNSVGKENKVGTSHYSGTEIGVDPDPAPAKLLSLPAGDASHFPVGTVFTLQGVITNPAVGPLPFRITNAIVLTVM